MGEGVRIKDVTLLFWDIVTGCIYKIDGSSTAVHKKLGWVLSGPTSVKTPSVVW